MQLGALSPVQGVRGDAAASCNAPGISNYRGTSSLCQAVDHRLGQLRLLHHLLDLLQLLVISPPPGGCCWWGEGGQHCTSYSTCRAWGCWTEQCLHLVLNYRTTVVTLVYESLQSQFLVQKLKGAGIQHLLTEHLINELTCFGFCIQHSSRARSRRSWGWDGWRWTWLLFGTLFARWDLLKGELCHLNEGTEWWMKKRKALFFIWEVR